MSETNITEKITNSISDVFKKTKIFEKIQRFEFYIGSFVFISSIIGITGIGINYYNNDLINKKLDKLYNNKELNEIKELKELNVIKELNEIKEILNENKNKVTEIRNEYIILFERQQKILEEILNINCYRENNSRESILPDEIPINNTELISEPDDELIDECYDSIPLSNAKKVPSIKNLIWFNK
jgi:hypothetical protein